MKRSWPWREWLPDADTLTLIGVTTTAETVVVEADGPSWARCPFVGAGPMLGIAAIGAP
ncbi:MAG: hypothetical protein ABJA98_00025 [Acidobacteriota bacterium]